MKCWRTVVGIAVCLGFVGMSAWGEDPATYNWATKAKLPLKVYSDAGADESYWPSGYMGNVAAIKVDNEFRDNPQSGSTCIKVSYNASGEWAGVAWQNPPNDWGDQPGGFDLTGATQLSFWARGEKGTEVVTFGYGMLGTDAAFSDSSKASLEKVPLTAVWKQYVIPLQGKDLSHIKTGFNWFLGGGDEPITFYLDSIQFE